LDFVWFKFLVNLSIHKIWLTFLFVFGVVARFVLKWFFITVNIVIVLKTSDFFQICLTILKS